MSRENLINIVQNSHKKSLNEIGQHHISGETFLFVKDPLPENINIYIERNNVNILLVLTIITAVLFVVSQFLGFNEIISQGYYFTGPESSVTTSYVYILVFLHLAHLFAGMIVLTVVISKFNKQKYEKNKLGFELALIFWHFLGALWIYLFFFKGNPYPIRS